jgi:hypothetical protein
MSPSGDGEKLTKIESDVVAAWNALPEEHARVARLGKRRQALRARLRDPWWREHWSVAMERLSALPNMRGKCGHPWVATFEWFVRPDSVSKLLEGVCDSWFRTSNTNHAGTLVEDLR